MNTATEAQSEILRGFATAPTPHRHHPVRRAYIEAEEQIGGFARIDVEDLHEAIEVSAGHPAWA